ncbi:uncharacterized protein CANTADRAFT_26975 [Suhomyces tanzawaensis NRRL Y-17324]|uniref:Altered inheritance of mitochondria protein 6 n=1 Tax=Suhomyces tanzawaensis NRRL Y-17324 TaxID=984487 RepID=A0A1E4SES4_9ASCO|nr:uncharacterized protein CANTADRAFT_26975 [Suhomyces tanzawaensis NRRL Y-17324]ODV78021.1 hypothetical protein CANTADRAFT_26975 [Suhomyces tanzawaensis NRRL Y-17324]
MISIFKPVARSSPPVSAYDGSGASTPILPFNHTVESLTRDVYVKPLHSHNDYWRWDPFFDALGAGCQSIESDVWYFPKGYKVDRTVTETTGGSQTSKTRTEYYSSSEVYVGHNQVYLKPIDTLFNLYLNPLFQFLEYSNPTFTYTEASLDQHSPLLENFESKHGVFYNSPETPLYFWMDFKTDPEATYNAIRPLLQPFIDKGYLAYYDASTDTFHPGPVVITITGNLPTELVKKEKIRYTFLDGPLLQFSSDSDENTLVEYSKLAKVASGSLEDLLGKEAYQQAKYNGFTEDQKNRIGSYFQLAHKHGLKTRIWGDVTWPNDLLNSHLKDLFQLKSDFLNVDDVKAATSLF